MKNETENQKQESGAKKGGSDSEKGNLTGPEGVLMLCVAAILDGLGLIFFCFSWLGIDDFGVLDIIGVAIIGGWLFIRKGRDSASGAFKKLLIAFCVEAVPFLGGISPSWIILVWKELKS